MPSAEGDTTGSTSIRRFSCPIQSSVSGLLLQKGLYNEAGGFVPFSHYQPGHVEERRTGLRESIVSLKADALASTKLIRKQTNAQATREEYSMGNY